MTYQEAIIALSSTKYDVSFHLNEIRIYESTKAGLIPVGQPEPFYGSWDDAIIKGAAMVSELQSNPPKKTRKRKK